MAQKYDDTKKADLMSFGKSFARLNGQPLDESAIWSSYEKAAAYAKTAGAYVGQIIGVLGENKVTFYGIQDIAGNLKEVGSKPVGDNKGIVIKTDGTVTIKGLSDATVGYIAKKASDGSIEWVKEYVYDDSTLKQNVIDLKAKDSALEGQINEQETRLSAVETSYIKNVAYAEKTGIFTFTLQDGSVVNYDLAIEKVVTNFKYDDIKQSLILTLADGTTQEVPMTAFINDYKGKTGTEIKIDISKSNEISASLVSGGVNSTKIADNAITTTKIADLNVTANKLEKAVTDNIAKGIDAQTRVGLTEGEISKLKSEVALKATQKDLESLESVVNNKAENSTVSAISKNVETNTSSIKEIKAKDTTQDELLEGLRTDVDTKQTASQVNTLIQAATIQGSKISGSVESAKKVDHSLTIKGLGTDIVYDGHENKIATIPAAMASSLGMVQGNAVENGIDVNNGKMTVHSLNVNKLVQTDSEELILNGGQAK